MGLLGNTGSWIDMSFLVAPAAKSRTSWSRYDWYTSILDYAVYGNRRKLWHPQLDQPTPFCAASCCASLDEVAKALPNNGILVQVHVRVSINRGPRNRPQLAYVLLPQVLGSRLPKGPCTQYLRIQGCPLKLGFVQNSTPPWSTFHFQRCL